jgi:Arc/MetJ family transcription regulator
MRTTIDIDDDVLAAATEVARLEKVSLGKAVSRLMRLALMREASTTVASAAVPSKTGFVPFPARGLVVSNELIDHLRDVGGV